MIWWFWPQNSAQPLFRALDLISYEMCPSSKETAYSSGQHQHICPPTSFKGAKASVCLLHEKDYAITDLP